MKGYLNKFVEKKKLSQMKLTELTELSSVSSVSKPGEVFVENKTGEQSKCSSIDTELSAAGEYQKKGLPSRCSVCNSPIKLKESRTLLKGFCTGSCPFVFYELKSGIELVVEELLALLTTEEMDAFCDAINEREAILIYEGCADAEALSKAERTVLPEFLEILEERSELNQFRLGHSSPLQNKELSPGEYPNE